MHDDWMPAVDGMLSTLSQRKVATWATDGLRSTTTRAMVLQNDSSATTCTTEKPATMNRLSSGETRPGSGDRQLITGRFTMATASLDVYGQPRLYAKRCELVAQVVVSGVTNSPSLELWAKAGIGRPSPARPGRCTARLDPARPGSGPGRPGFSLRHPDVCFFSSLFFLSVQKRDFFRRAPSAPGL